MKSINADHAAESLLELFKAKPWLGKPEVMTEDDAHAEAEAIMFLQKLVIHGADSYGNTSEPAKRIVCSLLLDFMAKVMHPAHPLSKKTWLVDSSEPMAEQALQIIAAEIADSHPQPQARH